MALLQEALEEKKYDVRQLEKKLSRNLILAEDVNKELKELPDDGANAEWSSIDALKTDGSRSS